MTEYEYLVKEFKEQIDLNIQALAAGRPQNIEEYRQIVGTIRGLEFAIQTVKDLVHRMENSDE